MGYDFTSKALSDKRLIGQLRSEKGRWVDYIIEFAKSIDNLVGYFSVMSEQRKISATQTQTAVDDHFHDSSGRRWKQLCPIISRKSNTSIY